MADEKGPPALICSRRCDVVPHVTLGKDDWPGVCEICEADVLIIPERWRAAKDRYGASPEIRCSPCARVFDQWEPNPAKTRRHRQLLVPGQN